MTENTTTPFQANELTEQELDAISGGTINGPWSLRQTTGYVGPCD